MTGYTEAVRLAEPIQYAFNELLENALTHARRAGYGNACVWVACQYYPSSDLIRLGVVDNGCGFLATLRGHPALHQETHLATILAALQPRVSCNRDLGLQPLNELPRELAVVYILRAAMQSIMLLPINIWQAGPCWQGVAIALVCKRQRLPEVHLRDLLPPLEPQPRVRLRFQ